MSRFIRRRAFSLIELLVVIGVLAIIVMILLPVLARMDENRGSRKPSCQNNLKQLGLAAHNYESGFQAFPYSKRTTTPQRSWAPDLLPALEQGNVVSDVNYNLNENWWRTIGQVAPNIGVTADASFKATSSGALNLEGGAVSVKGSMRAELDSPSTTVGSAMTTVSGQIVSISGSLVKLG